MSIPKDLTKKFDNLIQSNDYDGTNDITLLKSGFDAGILAAFESEHVLALVEALEGLSDSRGTAAVVAEETLAKWSKSNE